MKEQGAGYFKNLLKNQKLCNNIASTKASLDKFCLFYEGLNQDRKDLKGNLMGAHET